MGPAGAPGERGRDGPDGTPVGHSCDWSIDQSIIGFYIMTFYALVEFVIKIRAPRSSNFE